jgi:hypothetical protein
MSSPLDGVHELTLVPGTSSRNPLWDDLSLLGDESLQLLLVFVVDILFFGGTEPARAFLARDLAVSVTPLSSLLSFFQVSDLLMSIVVD